MAPERHQRSSPEQEFDSSEIESGVRLMYLANEGDFEGINEALDSGIDVNFKDIDSRTALHVAACQGHPEVVELLLKRGAKVDAKDRWGSTPLADAIYYKNQDVIKLLEEHGAKPTIAPMHVQTVREIPEYEIDPSELDFSNSVGITKGTYCVASWRGIQVAVKIVGDDVIMDEERVRAFRDELAVLQQIRHPNVVQFLGAVTQSTPMMIVTEYLPKCWSEKPFKRPTFRQIISRLEEVEKMLDHRRRLTMAFRCFGAVGRLHKSGQSESSGHSI